ncbi:hypothetical protein [Microvirga lotononidis]|uniref:Uncharacterized protein n=1 Tax=Microvirga lotononidis TaxID=864069 RepID=I4YP32_9HYPH|nr:hypothetical protein [Microvirga lotononidis]EIM25724.1 hypothetical protein MicloDRAFT_00064510 [Microvirga lotononidis]WQO25658.1 hypothetical protein U0023_13120 [Microvirga lotononidis]
MMHIDPASPAFERLPRRKQGFILVTHCGWTIEALMDEYGISEFTAGLWLDPDRYERRLASKKAYRKTPKGRAMDRACDARYRARLKAKEAA